MFLVPLCLRIRLQYVTELGIIPTLKEMSVDINFTVLFSWPSLRSGTCCPSNCSGLILFLKPLYLRTSRQKNSRVSRTTCFIVFVFPCALILFHNFATLSLALLFCSFFIIYEPFLNRQSPYKRTKQEVVPLLPENLQFLFICFM